MKNFETYLNYNFGLGSLIFFPNIAQVCAGSAQQNVERENMQSHLVFAITQINVELPI